VPKGDLAQGVLEQLAARLVAIDKDDLRRLERDRFDAFP
jgi:hypothetical protein